MNRNIVGRHVNLTDELKDFINGTIDGFSKYNLDIISVNSIISQEEKHGKPLITFEFVINVAHQDTIVVKQKDKDLHSAIDIAADRVSKILRRHHDKVTSHDATKLSEVFESEIQDAIAKELEQIEDEIVPMRLESYKPIDIQDALDELKDSDEVFKVFYDKDDNFRVIYKIPNTKQFGLY
jgi:putative sigma-54 modulation protein